MTSIRCRWVAVLGLLLVVPALAFVGVQFGAEPAETALFHHLRLGSPTLPTELKNLLTAGLVFVAVIIDAEIVRAAPPRRRSPGRR